MMTNTFSSEKLIDIGPHEFRRTLQRLMAHCGFKAFSVDGPNDKGGDIFCERGEERWIIQSKWKVNGTVGIEVVDELLSAMTHYDSNKGIIASNSKFSKECHKKLKNISSNCGLNIDLWDGDTIRKFSSECPQWIEKLSLRGYQKEALSLVLNDLEVRNKSLLYLATGLGKTVVAGEVIKHFVTKKNAKQILVLAHMNELVEQLQKSLWFSVPLEFPSQIINSLNSPDNLSGLTVSTQVSILKYIDSGYVPDLVVIDECHHIGEDNVYATILKKLINVPVVGVTATPWRGDGFSIEETLGEPSYSCGVEDGMKNGFLAPVEYSLFCDNIDWDKVTSLSKHNFSMAQLNRKLFIPERDEVIVDSLTSTWLSIHNPKAIVFCQTIHHAKSLHAMLLKYERWCGCELLHSGMKSRDRKDALLKFRSDRCPILVAVDILNEGVDVPDVNIVCFARVTHSRRIFIQQLGRGLRIADNKEKVIVLDFAADIRRMAAVSNLQKQAVAAPKETLHLPRNKISFNDQKAESLINEWLMDAADLETAKKEAVMQFPEV